MFIEKFEEYLNHYKISKADEEYLCVKGKVYFDREKYSKCDSEGLLSKVYFDVVDVSIDAIESKMKIFAITVKWRGIKKKRLRERLFCHTI